MPAIGISKSVVFKRKTLTAPDGAPSALIAVPYSGTRIDVFWTNGSTNEDSFNIYGSTDGVNFSVYDTAVAGSASQNMTGLTAGTNYWFYVTAVKGTQKSTASNTVATWTYPTELFDGHIPLWIPHEDTDLYTLDGVNVNEITDKHGSGKKFIGGPVKPTRTADGIYFPDLADMTATFNFNATYTMYVIMALHEYRANTNIIRLLTANGGIFFHDANNKYYYVNGTTGSFVNQYINLDTYGIFVIGCNASPRKGFFKIDNTISSEADLGNTSITGIKFNSLGAPGNYVNITVKEIILRDQYDYGTTALTNIINYLVKKKTLVEPVSPPVYDIDNMLLDYSGDKYWVTDDEQNYISTE